MAEGRPHGNMGIVRILAASNSRWPRIVRALGAVMCLQAIAAILFGINHARAIMEWETTQETAVLRAGAVVALAAGGFLVFAIAKRPSEEQAKAAHNS